MGQWVIHYVFPDPQDDHGATLCKVVQIRAQDETEARHFAHEIAPCEEFIFTLHPASDAQILGTVRHQALKMTGKAQSGDAFTADEDPGEAVTTDAKGGLDVPSVVNWDVDIEASSSMEQSHAAPQSKKNTLDATAKQRRAIIDRVRTLSRKKR